jgi:hypothetical protein
MILGISSTLKVQKEEASLVLCATTTLRVMLSCDHLSNVCTPDDFLLRCKAKYHYTEHKTLETILLCWCKMFSSFLTLRADINVPLSDSDRADTLPTGKCMTFMPAISANMSKSAVGGSGVKLIIVFSSSLLRNRKFRRVGYAPLIRFGLTYPNRIGGVNVEDFRFSIFEVLLKYRV